MLPFARQLYESNVCDRLVEIWVLEKRLPTGPYCTRIHHTQNILRHLTFELLRTMDLECTLRRQSGKANVKL